MNPRQHHRHLVAAGLFGFTLLVLAGCSGADPADVAKVADQYTGSTNPLAVPVTEDQARCRAEAYLESDLSDSALDDVRAGRQPVARTKEDAKVLTALADELAACV
ncbi:hypothetical protein [Nocardioides sp. WS12]|uniref:hypothetical protein n=1 Tax=Nocardioides sp. WS12 TaxID=2486272 RepID=UPI0015FDA5BC|nr:hypothetical protein [Nocardioides sp. WS12]